MGYSDCRNYVAVAVVLSNWHNVLRAINMASSESADPLKGERAILTTLSEALEAKSRIW